MALTDTLKKSELFGGLDTAHLRKVGNLCRNQSFKEGHTIFSEGDDAEEIYILLEGRVVLEMEVRPVADRPGIPTAVEVISEGETFGWSALVEPYVYTLSARCLTHCRALAIKGDLLRKFLADDTSLGYELMRRLTKIIALRLAHTRFRLTSGLGLALLGKEIEGAKNKVVVSESGGSGNGQKDKKD
jgi:toluene monooxygenase system ferredoxin subunit